MTQKKSKIAVAPKKLLKNNNYKKINTEGSQYCYCPDCSGTFLLVPVPHGFQADPYAGRVHAQSGDAGFCSAGSGHYAY